MAFNVAIEIEDIEKTATEKGSIWTIITQQGNFEFISEGYEQFFRQEPFYQFVQSISFTERNGFSLDQITNQTNPNRLREDILEQRKKDLEYYESAKQRHIKRKEKNQLNKAKENNEIDLKEYLVKKKKIKEMLDYYDYWLKDTKFENW